MKIRKGFVSNSSSTSFCIFGVTTEYNEELDDSLWRDKTTPLDFQAGCGDSAYDYFIGVSPNEIKEDETFGQFRDRVAAMIAEKLGEPVESIKPTYHWDGGYDG